MKRVSLSKAIAIGLLLLQLNAAFVSAQKLSEAEVEHKKRERDFAVYEKDIAEAKLAELKAKYPSSTTTPLAGATTINDGAVIEGQMMSYASMAVAANKLAANIKLNMEPAPNEAVKPMSVFVIYSANEMSNLLSYRTASKQLEILKDNYCEILDGSATNNICPPAGVAGTMSVPGVLAGLKIFSSFLGGFVDATSLLRTNVDIKGQSVAIDEEALVTETFRALREEYDGSPLALYYPAVFPPDIDLNAGSRFLQKLEHVRNLKLLSNSIAESLTEIQSELKKTAAAIQEATKAREEDKIKKAEADTNLAKLGKGKSPAEKIERARLQALAKKLEDSIAALTDKLDKLTVRKATLEAERQLRLDLLRGNYTRPDNADEALTRLKAFNQQFDQLVTALTQPNQTSGINLLTSYLKAESLDDVMNCRGYLTERKQYAPCRGYWLQLKVLKAGGNNRIKTNFVVDIFTGGNRLSHSGGSVVQFHLFDKYGRSLLSDTRTEYTRYIKSSKVKELPQTILANEKQQIDIP